MALRGGPIYRVIDSKTGETAYIVSMTDARTGERVKLTDRTALLPAGEDSKGLVVKLVENEGDNASASRMP